MMMVTRKREKNRSNENLTRVDCRLGELAVVFVDKELSKEVGG